MIQPLIYRAFALLCLALALGGCAVPNVEPFADATVELRRAIAASGAVTADTMQAAAKTNAGQKNDAAQFAEIWQDRIKLMDVLLGYSDAVAGVAAAGAQSRQTTKALSESVSRLARIVPVSGSAVEAGVKLGEVLIQTGINIGTHRALDKAVSAAHPDLKEVAGYLEADLDDLRRLYVNAWQDMESALDDRYGKREHQRDKLLEKRDQLRDNLIGTFNDTNVDQVKLTEELVAQMEPEHRAYVQARAALLANRAATLQMFEKSKQGVRAWVQAHEGLAVAIKQNRQPNIRLILSAAQEIKDAVDRVREL